MAMLRCLQGRREEGRAFWEEAEEGARYVFRGKGRGGGEAGGGGELLLTQASVPVVEGLLGLYKRLCVCALGLGVAGVSFGCPGFIFDFWNKYIM